MSEMSTNLNKGTPIKEQTNYAQNKISEIQNAMCGETSALIWNIVNEVSGRNN